MHVAFISPRWPPTPCGIGDYTWNLSEALIEAGARVSILTKRMPVLEKLEGADIHAVSRGWRGPGILKFAPLLARLQPDILHLQYEGYGFNQSFLLPALWRAHRGAKVLTLHEVWFKNRLHKLRDSFLHREADHVIVNDQGCLERVQGLGLRAPVAKIGVGANIPLGATDLEPPDDVIRAGYFGFFNGNKSIGLLIEAAAGLIRERGMNLELLLIGAFDPVKNAEHRALKTLAERLAPPGRIRFTGLLGPDDVARTLSTCHFAVLPYIDGASPRRGSLQACLGLGVPVVTLRSAYSESDLVDGRTVRYAREPSREGLREAMSELAENAELRARLRAGGLEAARAYAWPALARRHLEIYERVLSSRPKS
ncbi:MAG TPA: glycosyltransferase family 4 protein [Bdellovibrionales bacterium]|nr:glycosyltransferase family 4 protein [Bdellovibrionales bacterium]